MAAALTPTLAESSGSGSGKREFWRLLLGITLPILLIDQLSKLYIASHLALHEDVVLIPNWLDITYTLNPGAAFSLFAGMPAWFRNSFLLGLAAGAIVVLVVLLIRDPRFSLTSAALALILAGAIGNLIDRVWRGPVVDFILMHYYRHNYPVFNVADSAITI
ncbi:MAG: signal peptidase II, partial [Candidatus Binataceae bacterium]